MKKIAIFNHKGGVSKTTTAFHIGWMLANKGKKVLFVDADSQCNLTMMFMGYSKYDDFLMAGDKNNIKIIGTRHGEKKYETLLTNEECAKAIDMGKFYRVPADNRGLNYDKFFKEGNVKQVMIEEFNSNNTRRLNLEETKAKIASLEYIQNELNGIPSIVK